MSPRRPRSPLLAPEQRALLLALLALAGAWLFAALAWAALHGESHALDEAALRALRVPGAPEQLRGPALLVHAARDLTALGSHAVLALVIAATTGFLLLLRKPVTALAVFAAGAGGMALNGVLKQLFARARPQVVPPLVDVDSPSFPSGHALLSAAVYLSLAIVAARAIPARRVRLYVLAAAATLVALVGLTRIILGVHYPTDVVAGWIIGGLWALLCGLEARTLQRRGTVEPAGIAPEIHAPQPPSLESGATAPPSAESTAPALSDPTSEPPPAAAARRR
jgi:undecaprenyl-diphosphatase